MSDIQPAGPLTPFDGICHIDDQGNEYWFARELMPKLGYDKWSNFIRAVNGARTACDSQGYDVAELFTAVGKKSSGGRPSQDYQLTRFACYMIALSADGTKSEVAAAKTYFAIMTHEREQEEIGLLTDPEAALEEWKERAIRSYMAHGFSEAYARNRVDGILTRKAITGKWVVSGIKVVAYI